MEERIRQLRQDVLTHFPTSRLDMLPPERRTRLRTAFPDLPDHLLQFFAGFGTGPIGNGRYVIWDLFNPDDIFDPETARGLGGIVLIGNDYSEGCEAYDRNRGWQFGWIGEAGHFQPHVGCPTIIDFLEQMMGDRTP